MNLAMSFASAVAFALLHSLWQLALLGLLAAISFAALRQAGAGTRHTVGMVWLLAMAAAPVSTFAAYWQMPVLSDAADSAFNGAVAAPIRLGDSVASFAQTPWHGWLLVCLSQVWLVGVALMAVRQIGGWRLVRRIESQAFVELPPEWQRRVDALRAAMGISRRVGVRLARHIASPFTAHAWRPLIWLPLALLTQLPVAQVEALLAHELAHIRRLDWCWNALQCGIEALLFHHPAMWWLSRRIREEREHACDDLAVSVSGDAMSLAEGLAALQFMAAAPPFGNPSFRNAALAAEGGALMKRVRHLLSAAPARQRPGWRMPGVLLLTLCCGSLLAMQVTPPAHLLTRLSTDASSAGELTPGNQREITASYLGEKQRHYRIAMDAQGRVEEHYTEGGEPRPIDAGVRSWLRAMTDMSAPAVPAALPPLPALSSQPHPTPRGERLSDESAALIESIRTDPRVTALTGTPARFDRRSMKGHIRVWGSRDFRLWGIDDPVGGKAALSASFEGPNGRASVAYLGRTVNGGHWKAESFTVSPLTR